jgi:hypothetical protein
MFAVGALDAYYCDAYTDVVAATIISKSRHPKMALPDFFYDIKFPVRAILEPYAINLNWRWRTVARKMMERENVLTLAEVRRLFNRFFRDHHKFFGDVLDDWISHRDAKRRLFGVTPKAYARLAAADKEIARQLARDQMEERFGATIQRRHDCIHNCDRPRVSPQPLVKGDTFMKVIEDVEFLVARCDEHTNVEFREFLLLCGCPPPIVAQAGY